MKLFEYASILYNELESRAYRGTFTGYVSTVAVEAGIPLTYVGQVTPLLMRSGAVTYERRGGKHAPSIIHLNHPPDIDGIRAARKERKTATAHVEQATKDLLERVSKLEAAVFGP